MHQAVAGWLAVFLVIGKFTAAAKALARGRVAGPRRAATALQAVGAKGAPGAGLLAGLAPPARRALALARGRVAGGSVAAHGRAIGRAVAVGH